MPREGFKELVGKFFSRIQDGSTLELYITYRMVVSMGGKMVVEDGAAGRNLIRISFPFKKRSDLIMETMQEEGRAWEGVQPSAPSLAKDCDDDPRIAIR